MNVIRVTEEWQRAGVHYVRTQAMCLGFEIPLEMEFDGDKPEDEYILVSDGLKPVSTCRIHYLEDDHVIIRTKLEKPSKIKGLALI